MFRNFAFSALALQKVSMDGVHGHWTYFIKHQQKPTYH